MERISSVFFYRLHSVRSAFSVHSTTNMWKHLADCGIVEVLSLSAILCWTPGHRVLFHNLSVCIGDSLHRNIVALHTLVRLLYRNNKKLTIRTIVRNDVVVVGTIIGCDDRRRPRRKPRDQATGRQQKDKPFSLVFSFGKGIWGHTGIPSVCILSQIRTTTD